VLKSFPLMEPIVQIRDLTKVYGHGEAEVKANRSKGTLQLKMQVANPDRFLTPELTAKVDSLWSDNYA
jgi:hypothetical protein